MVAFLMFACIAVAAQVHRRVKPDGTVYFSDRPGPDAEEVEAAPAQTVRMPAAPAPRSSASQSPEQDEGVFRYTRAAIVSPVEGQGVRANDGIITVQIALEPSIQPGHAIVVTLDGASIEFTDPAAIRLTNLSRGRHQLEAVVVDDRGRELRRVDPVGFYVLRTSSGG